MWVAAQARGGHLGADAVQEETSGHVRSLGVEPFLPSKDWVLTHSHTSTS